MIINIIVMNVLLIIIRKVDRSDVSHETQWVP